MGRIYPKIIDRKMFKKAVFSIQNNRLLALSMASSITNITSIIGITYVPDTMFQIREIIDVRAAETMWTFLSSSRYLGANPTPARDTTDKNGRN